MAKLYKPTKTRYLLDGKHVARNVPGAVKVTVQSRKWHGRYTDEHGRRRTAALSTDKGVAESMLADIKRAVARCKSGDRDISYADAARTPVADHLADYLAMLSDKGDTQLHVDTEKARLSKVCDGCAFRYIADFDAPKLSRWLARQRKAKPNFGVKTSNQHLRAIKGFAKWLVDHHRARHNPFTSLRPANTEIETPRHARRVLTDGDFHHLLTVTRQSSRVDGKGTDWRFTGDDRYHLYLTAAFTGLRASELASLTAGSFDFVAETLRLHAADSKHRQTDVLPLLSQLSEKLQQWFARRRLKPSDKLWAGSWATRRRAAQILRRDLQEAGIPYRDEQNRVYDFHCLRGQFATMLVKHKVPIKHAQELMRHSDINLTANIYAKLSPSDLAGEINKLTLPA